MRRRAIGGGLAAQNAEAKRSITAWHWDNQDKMGADARALVFDVFLGGESLVATVSSRLLTLPGLGWVPAIEERGKDGESLGAGRARPRLPLQTLRIHANRIVPPTHCREGIMMHKSTKEAAYCCRSRLVGSCLCACSNTRESL
jgi:hypothetical protein